AGGRGPGERGGGRAGRVHRQPDRLPGGRAEGVGTGQPAAGPVRPQAAAESISYLPRIFGRRARAMSQPSGFSWIEKPLLAALARPTSREELDWLRAQGIQVLVSLTEDPVRRDWVNDAGLMVYHVPMED